MPCPCTGTPVDGHLRGSGVGGCTAVGVVRVGVFAVEIGVQASPCPSTCTSRWWPPPPAGRACACACRRQEAQGRGGPGGGRAGGAPGRAAPAGRPRAAAEAHCGCEDKEQGAQKPGWTWAVQAEQAVPLRRRCDGNGDGVAGVGTCRAPPPVAYLGGALAPLPGHCVEHLQGAPPVGVGGFRVPGFQGFKGSRVWVDKKGLQGRGGGGCSSPHPTMCHRYASRTYHQQRLSACGSSCTYPDATTSLAYMPT